MRGREERVREREERRKGEQRGGGRGGEGNSLKEYRSNERTHVKMLV